MHSQAQPSSKKQNNPEGHASEKKQREEEEKRKTGAEHPLIKSTGDGEIMLFVYVCFLSETLFISCD